MRKTICQSEISGAVLTSTPTEVGNTFIDFKEVPHDSNLTINVLLQTLAKYPENEVHLVAYDFKEC